MTVVSMLTYINSTAQVNLVPNPSFEDTVACPINGWISNCLGWDGYSSSPDYYNSCAPSWSGHSVPLNFAGAQVAASGQAYMGAICYGEGETDYSLNREIIGRDLAYPLTIGQKYYVSFKTSLVGNTPDVGSTLAINKLGTLFSTVPYNNSGPSTIPPIQNFAHVVTNSIVSDTTNWVMIFGSFIADSAYEYISIGNFFETTYTDTIHFISGGQSPRSAYYLLDDICVSLDSIFCANYSYTGIVEPTPGVSYDLYPNPAFSNVNISFEDEQTHVVTVLNSVGEIVWTDSIVGNGILATESFDSGVYFVQSFCDGIMRTKKLILY